MSNTSKVILGLLGATAVGVAIGILIAPEKGVEIRKKFSNTANDIVSMLGDIISAGKNKIAEMTETVKEKSEELSGDLKNENA